MPALVMRMTMASSIIRFYSFLIMLLKNRKVLSSVLAELAKRAFLFFLFI
jgi:hypothetical protein